jgi:short-subunit dehydrogenase
LDDFKNKVAVITGAASGIGRAIAAKCAKEKMKIVIADIDKESLRKTEKEIIDEGVEILAVVANVAKEDEIKTLALKTLDCFGEVHLLFNNAGVCSGALILNSTISDWKWIIDVNLWSVIYGTSIFFPIMQKQQDDCYIVNTASQAGIETSSDNGLYRVTKHAVVSYSEALFYELKTINSKIGVSVLCPGWTSTQLYKSQRMRPVEYLNYGSETEIEVPSKLVEGIKSGMSPVEVVEDAFNSIRKGQFYIFPYPLYKIYAQHRMEDIINKRNPSPVILR